MRKLLTNLAFVVVLVSMLTIAYSCSDNTVTPTTTYDQLSINGRITFPDTAGYYKFTDTSKGYYNISAFSKWPPMGPASANSKLVIKMEGGKMVADYKLIVPANGYYAVTSAYIKLPYLPFGSVYGLGKYMSDTTHNPIVVYDSSSSAKVSITGNQGVGNINFLSWIDTTKKIYQF